MKPGLRITFKTLAGSLGFLPVLVLTATRLGFLPEKGQEKGAMLLLLPVGGVAMLTESFQVPKPWNSFIILGVVLVWSLVLAWVCWQYAKMLLGEDEITGRPFDWAAWRLRFVIGFIIGFLLGWRFVRNSETPTIIVAMVLTGILGGLALGAWRENFWSRPL